MIARINTPLVRYSLLLLACGIVASVPWILSILSSPLPPDLQRTGTLLAVTRTARFDPILAVTLIEALGFTATPSFTPTFTVTATPTDTPPATFTRSPIPTNTATPTITPSPTPVVLGQSAEVLNTYTCPGAPFRSGSLEKFTVFDILGWDQTEEEGEIVFWILIEDLADQPQIWIRESDFIVLTHPNFKDFVARSACRIFP
jgi:hypothetical protein